MQSFRSRIIKSLLRIKPWLIGIITAVFLSIGRVGAAQPDILITDFERQDYNGWTTAGTAFGIKPASSAIEDQQPVFGYKGRGFANSFNGGDAATGTLTSPPFTLSRHFINLLVGGGEHPGETCANLLSRTGKTIWTSTGANSERLEWRTWDVSKYTGQTVRIQIVDKNTGGWGHINIDHIVQSDIPKAPSAETPPTGQWLPQYHYTPARNFMNDPNGLVYYEGEWHIFHQYNPQGNKWGHMSWNHAVSRDLIHWKELGVALKEENGVMIFSGSAVVDKQNTSGFGKNGQPPLVAIYTGYRVSDEMQSQCIAYSTDRGRTWIKYANNPVIGWETGFRDPKVFWHEPTKKWVMVVAKADEKVIRFYRSKDLKRWDLLSTFGPAGVPVTQKPNWECPDLFPLPIEGEPGSRWLLHVGIGGGHISGGSGGEYFIGTFDGTTFHNDNPADKVLYAEYGKDNYAAVSWDGILGPSNERYWIGWMSNLQYSNDAPTFPWRNGLTLPRLLKLRRFSDGLRLVSNPVPQMRSLRGFSKRYSEQRITPAKPFVPGHELFGDALEIEAEFEAESASEFGLAVRKGAGEVTLVGYDAQKGEVFVDRSQSGRSDFSGLFAGRNGGPVVLQNGRLKMHLFVDRASVELFANDGETVMTELIFPKRESRGIEVFAKGGDVRLVSLHIWKLAPAPNRQSPDLKTSLTWRVE